MNVNGREFNNAFSTTPYVPPFFLVDEISRSELEYFGGSVSDSSADGGSFQPDCQVELSILSAILPQEVTWQLAKNRRPLFESASFQHLKTRTTCGILRRN